MNKTQKSPNMKHILKNLKYPNGFLDSLLAQFEPNSSFLERCSKIVPFMPLDEKSRKKLEEIRKTKPSSNKV